MCVNPACEKYSLMCQDDDCSACGDEAHEMCLSIKMKAITKMLRKRAYRQRSFLEDLNKIEDLFI